MNLKKDGDAAMHSKGQIGDVGHWVAMTGGESFHFADGNLQNTANSQFSPFNSQFTRLGTRILHCPFDCAQGKAE